MKYFGIDAGPPSRTLFGPSPPKTFLGSVAAATGTVRGWWIEGVERFMEFCFWVVAPILMLALLCLLAVMAWYAGWSLLIG